MSNHGFVPIGCALTLGLLVLGCGPQPRPAAAPPAAAPQAGLEKLTGKWLRTPDPYVLEIKAVAPDGRLDAAYFNPNPIKVSAARATREGGVLKVFVELRDEGYPGCTYTLNYDAQADQLVGVYYQAAQQQSYEIAFVRMP